MWGFVFVALAFGNFFDDESEPQTWDSDIPETTDPVYPLSNAPVIAGAVCGSLAGLMAIVMLSYYCCRRKTVKDPDVYARIN